MNKRSLELEAWLSKNGCHFDKEMIDEGEYVFYILRTAVYLPALEFELHISDTSDHISISCEFIPAFPQKHKKQVAYECERLSFIHYPTTFCIDEKSESILAFRESKTTEDFIADIIIELELLKDAIEEVVHLLLYVIWNERGNF